MSSDPNAEDPNSKDLKAKKGHIDRTAARLFAVQALYQMDIAQSPLENIIDEFRAYRLDHDQEELSFSDVDDALFDRIMRGVVSDQVAIDQAVNDRLSDRWPLARVDSTMRAIFRAGAFELMNLVETNSKILVSEYTDIAHSFFEGPEVGMVNAVLDRVAKDFAANS
jgi:N utilization substance protein B